VVVSSCTPKAALRRLLWLSQGEACLAVDLVPALNEQRASDPVHDRVLLGALAEPPNLPGGWPKQVRGPVPGQAPQLPGRPGAAMRRAYPANSGPVHHGVDGLLSVDALLLRSQIGAATDGVRCPVPVVVEAWGSGF
jgi:hypothetical protein